MRPLVTEKACIARRVTTPGVWSVASRPRTTCKAVEQLFNVRVLRVHTQNQEQAAHAVRSGQTRLKKAIVKLHSEDRIDF